MCEKQFAGREMIFFAVQNEWLRLPGQSSLLTSYGAA